MEVWTGGAPILYYISGPLFVGQTVCNTYYANHPSSYQDLFNSSLATSILTYEWKIEPYAPLYYYSHTGQVCVDFSNSSMGSYYLSCRVSNGCGITDWVDLEIQVGYNKSSAYPNPVSDILNVELYQSRQAAGGNLAYDIRLYNMQGNLVRQTTTQGSRVQFDVSGLRDGTYFLHIYDGMNSKPEMTTVIVKH